MSRNDWRRRFQSSLRKLAHFIWQPTPDSLRQEQLNDLADKLQRRHQRMVRIQQRLEHWRGRLIKLVHEEENLVPTVQCLYREGQKQEAYALSQALDSLRQKQAFLQQRIQRGEALYQYHCRRFQELKQDRLS